MTSLDEAFGSSSEQMAAIAAGTSALQHQPAAVAASASPPSPSPPPPPPADELKTPYGRVLAQLVRFVTAVQATPVRDDDADVTAEVRAKWNAVPAPKTDAELHAAVSRMYAMNPQQLAATLGAADASTRLYFHGQAIKLAQAVKVDTDELAFAAATMRWFLQTALPALRGQPEEAQLGTVKEIRRNYAALDATCKVARPDNTNPAVVAASEHLADARAAIDNLNTALQGLQNRARRVGLDFGTARHAEVGGNEDALAEMDDAALAAVVRRGSSTAKKVNIVLGVFLAIAVVAIVVLVVYLVRGCKATGSPASASASSSAKLEAPPLPAPTSAAFGGRHSSSDSGFLTHGRLASLPEASPFQPQPSPQNFLDTTMFTGRSGATYDNWGFPPIK